MELAAGYCLQQPWCRDQASERGGPYPSLGSGDADGDRASQFQHTVEDMDGDVHFGRPAPVRARAQAVTDHLLEPTDGRLGSGPLRVSGGFLPDGASVLGNELNSAVWLGTAVERGGTMIAASG